MAALVHDRVRSDRAWPEPPGRDDARRSRDLDPGIGPGTTGCRPEEQRRHPVVALLVVVGLLLAGGPLVDNVASLAGGSAPGGSSPSGEPTVVEGRVHVVQPGDTYWSIAEAVGGRGDIRARVAALEEANGGRSLQAGDRLAVPVLD